MSDKTKNIVVTIGFVLLLFIILISHILKTPTKISITERRKKTTKQKTASSY